jgi:hypothetical protein
MDGDSGPSIPPVFMPMMLMPPEKGFDGKTSR